MSKLGCIKHVFPRADDDQTFRRFLASTAAQTQPAESERGELLSP